MSARVGAFAFKEKAKKKLPFIMVRDCIIISKETVKIVRLLWGVGYQH